jgi:hypothetical protein
VHFFAIFKPYVNYIDFRLMLVPAAQCLFAVILTYNLCLCFTKLAILLLYYRVFVLHRTRTVSKVLIVFVVCYGIEATFAVIFSCIPVQAAWDGNAFMRACSPVLLLTAGEVF